jgi:DNA polymerase I-like protein with 3'-5' exonuclease and polymerase domains
MGRHLREIRSMYGRRILLDESLSLRELRGAFLNYPIQSTASDLLKLTMLGVLQGADHHVSIMASVHDEILLAVDLGHLRSAKDLLREAAAQAGRLVLGPDTPVRLEMGSGKSWWDAVLNAKEKKK